MNCANKRAHINPRERVIASSKEGLNTVACIPASALNAWLKAVEICFASYHEISHNCDGAFQSGRGFHRTSY
jgi:hypothetical protein